MKIRHAALVLFLSLLIAQPIASARENAKAAAKVGFSEDFTEPAVLKKLTIGYYGKVANAAKRARLRISNGALVIEGDFGPDSRRDDTVKLRWGSLGRKTARFDPIDLKEYPIIELRARSGTGESFSFPLFIGFRRQNGEFDYVYVLVRAGNPQDPAKWAVRRLRFAADSVAPSANTPRWIVGLQINVPNTGKPNRIELDWIRARGPLPSELKENEALKRLFAGYRRPSYKLFDTFFPWGIYTTGNVKRPFESWAGGYEGIFAAMVENRVNFVSINDEIEYGRMGAGAGDASFKRFASAMKKMSREAEATGIRIVADVRRMMNGRAIADGYEQLRPEARKVVDALRGCKAVAAYFIGDEPSADRLAPIVAIKRAFEELDTARPCVVVFNAVAPMKTYAHYLTVNYWDSYPVRRGDRDPWKVGRRASQYRRAGADMPMWVVLQAFAATPEGVGHGSYVRPSGAEMRMMTYLALGYGAKGIIWYSWWTGSGSGDLLGSRTAYTAHNGMMREVAELGRLIVPMKVVLLKCDAVAKLPVRLTRDGAKAKPEPHASQGAHGLVAMALKRRGNGRDYVVVVNEDLDAPHSGSLALRAGSGGLALWDLNDLKAAPRLGGRFRVETLAGGDGRIYLVGKESDFREDAAAIRCARALEDIRVLTPDLTVARRWKLDTAEVERHIAACRKAAEGGDAQAAERSACDARKGLKRLIASDSLLRMTRSALKDMAVELTELSRIGEIREKAPKWWTGGSHPMLVPNRTFGETAVRYWRLGRRFDDLMRRYRAGEKKYLWRDLNSARVELLEVRDELLRRLAQKLRPAK